MFTRGYINQGFSLCPRRLTTTIGLWKCPKFGFGVFHFQKPPQSSWTWHVCFVLVLSGQKWQRIIDPTEGMSPGWTFRRMLSLSISDMDTWQDPTVFHDLRALLWVVVPLKQSLSPKLWIIFCSRRFSSRIARIEGTTFWKIPLSNSWWFGNHGFL